MTCTKCGIYSSIVNGKNKYCHGCRREYNADYHEAVKSGKHVPRKRQPKPPEEPRPIWTAWEENPLMNKPYTLMNRTEMKAKADELRTKLNWS